jgi:ATP-binding cassette subfamily C exporter for protease/lipase
MKAARATSDGGVLDAQRTNAADPPREKLRPGEPATLMRRTRGAIRRELWPVAGFSLAINLLALVSSIYLMELFDRVLTSGSYGTLLWLTVLAIGATAVFGFLGSVRRRILIRIGDWLERELGAPAIDATMSLRLAGAGRDGAAASRALADIKAFVANEGVVAFLDAPWAPVFILAIAALHPLLGLYALAAALLLVLLALLNEGLTREPADAAALAVRRAQRMAEEAAAVAETAMALGMRTTLLRRWHAAQRRAGELGLAQGDRSALLVSTAQFLRLGLQLGILGLGAWLVLEGAITSGGMIAASVLLSRALAPADRALPAWKTFVAARTGARTLEAIFRQAPALPPKQRLPRPEGRLVIENVTHSLPGAEAPLLRNVSFGLKPGESLGILGLSGAGKSTLANLMVGAWRPQRGSIRLDHATLEQWDDDELGRDIGFLPQYPSLLTGTLAENIARMGEPNDEAVVAAARLAGAHEMILHLPYGYDTWVGFGGAGLSGGEQQRVALARALYGEPALVVLDEPDSHADALAAQLLQRTIVALRQRGTTLVVITHDVAALRLMDRLLMLRNGEVVTFGPRDEVEAVLAARRANVVPLQGKPLEGGRPAIASAADFAEEAS